MERRDVNLKAVFKWLLKHMECEVPCVGGVEYLHRSPASRRRRRKGNPVPGGINWATLFRGDIHTGIWPSRFGGSRIWDSQMWSWVPWESDLKMTTLARTSSNCKRQSQPLVRDAVTWGLWPQVFSYKIKLVVVSLNGLVAKTNWWAVNRQS
jgi:hypothetical protein